MVKHLPSAQGMISRSWDRVPTWGSQLGEEPASPSPSASPPACALSLSLSLSQKKKKKSKYQNTFICQREESCAIETLNRTEFLFSPTYKPVRETGPCRARSASGNGWSEQERTGCLQDALPQAARKGMWGPVRGVSVCPPGARCWEGNGRAGGGGGQASQPVSEPQEFWAGD